VDKLGVEVTLVARIGLLGAKLHLAEGFGVGNSFIDSGVDARGEGEE
jgi:hypothetical protein